MNKYKHLARKHALLLLAASGVLIGLILGAILKACNLSQPLREAVGFPGELFFRALQMLILPSIIFSLVAASSSLNVKQNGKVAMRTFTYFFLTSLFNTFLGVLLVVTIRPGVSDVTQQSLHQVPNPMAAMMAGMGMGMGAGGAGAGAGTGGPGAGAMAGGEAAAAAAGGGHGGIPAGPKAPSMMENMMDLWRNMVPDNMFTTLFEMTGTVYEPIPVNATFVLHNKKLIKRPGTNLLGVIVISLVFGVILSTLKDQGAVLIQLVKTVDLVLTKLLRSLIWLMPVGVASIVAAKMLESAGAGTMMNLMSLFVITVVVGLLAYQLVFLQLMYYLVVRKNPFRFYLDMLPAAAAGFAGQSSSVAYPVALQCLDERTKIEYRISRFVIPLGVIVNMDGTALFVTVASIFIAQLNNVSLSFMDYMSICMAATSISVAAAATPSSSVLLLFVILSAIGVPPMDAGLLLAVDWFLDRLRTTNNVLGDCYGAAIIQHLSRHELKETDGLAVSTTEFTEAHDTELDEVELK